MGKLEDLIKKAKNYDDVAMLEIVDMFQPVVRKYSRMMNHDEDIASELVLALIELVHNIRLDKLDAPNDYVLISYIGRSLYHKYIYVSQKDVRLSIVRHHTKMMLNSNGLAMTLPYRSFPTTLK